MDHRVALLWTLLACGTQPPAPATTPVAGESYTVPARTEVHPFETLTLTDAELLAGETRSPITIAGELRIPTTGTARLPAVVLVHGSGGITEGQENWELELERLGIATFSIDYFAGRHIDEAASDAAHQAQLGRLAMIADAYRALDLLSNHRRIDPARIALMGFSRGGTIALYAGSTRFQRQFGRPGTRFAGYLAFYGACNMQLQGELERDGAPLRLFHGEHDSWVRIDACRELVGRLAAAKQDVELFAYPGGHAFDMTKFRVPKTLPKAVTPGTCMLEERTPGAMFNRDTDQLATPNDVCRGRAPTLAYDKASAQAARRDVRAFLTQIFKLSR